MAKQGYGPLPSVFIIVTVAASCYSCAEDPNAMPDGGFDKVAVCVDKTTNKRTLDQFCATPPGEPQLPFFEWRAAPLPPSPTHEESGTDDEGYPYTETVTDYDDDSNFVVMPIGGFVGNNYSRSYDSRKLLSGTAPRGGSLSRSGAGSASSAGTIMKGFAPSYPSGTASKSTVSRGGLGVKSGSSGGSSSSGS